MNDALNVPRRRTRPGFRRLAIVAFVILLPVAAHALWDYIETRRLVREVVRIRDSGEPVAERDLVERSDRTAEEKQAARIYMAAAALAVSPLESDKALATDLANADAALNADASLRSNLVNRLEASLRVNDEAMGLLDKATPLAFNGFGPGTEYSYRSQGIWTLAGVNELRVAYACLRNDPNAAVEAAIATARLVRADPYRAYWTRPGPTRVAFILSYCPPSAAALAKLQQTLEAATIDKTGAAALTRWSMHERVRVLQAARRYYWFDTRLPEQYDFKNWSVGETVFRPWVTHRLVGELHDRARVIEVQKLPARARAEALRALPRPVSSGGVWTGGFGWGSVLSSLDLQVSSILNSQVFSMTTIVATAVERYRRDNEGRLPPNLAALVPKYLTSVPLDPYTDESVLFQQDANGYVVYSVGTDGKDDGGDLRSGPPAWQSGQPTPSKDRGVHVTLRPATK